MELREASNEIVTGEDLECLEVFGFFNYPRLPAVLRGSPSLYKTLDDEYGHVAGEGDLSEYPAGTQEKGTALRAQTPATMGWPAPGLDPHAQGQEHGRSTIPAASGNALLS